MIGTAERNGREEPRQIVPQVPRFERRQERNSCGLDTLHIPFKANSSIILEVSLA